LLYQGNGDPLPVNSGDLCAIIHSRSIKDRDQGAWPNPQNTAQVMGVLSGNLRFGRCELIRRNKITFSQIPPQKSKNFLNP
jgi:hypothetical protein